jgi:hypothetical protein
MNLDNQSYFRRRALEEDKAARNAACEIARSRHMEMAALYRGRCSSPRIRRAFQPMAGHEMRFSNSQTWSMLGA